MSFLNKPLCAAVALLASVTSTHAVFTDLGGGVVYDSTRNLTWTQDVRFFEVDLGPVARLFSLYGVGVHDVEGTVHSVTELDVYQGLSGLPVAGTWWGATAYASTLSLGGASGWRLPTESELLGVFAAAGYSNTFIHPYFHVSYVFWTSTEVGNYRVAQVQNGGPDAISSYTAGKGADSTNVRQVAWAVHEGNISQVPEPNSGMLMVLGATGFAIAHWRRKSRPWPSTDGTGSAPAYGPCGAVTG